MGNYRYCQLLGMHAVREIDMHAVREIDMQVACLRAKLGGCQAVNEFRLFNTLLDIVK